MNFFYSCRSLLPCVRCLVKLVADDSHALQVDGQRSLIRPKLPHTLRPSPRFGESDAYTAEDARGQPNSPTRCRLRRVERREWYCHRVGLASVRNRRSGRSVSSSRRARAGGGIARHFGRRAQISRSTYVYTSWRSSTSRWRLLERGCSRLGGTTIRWRTFASRLDSSSK